MRGGRCEAHALLVRRPVDDRPSAAARGYDAKWRMTRARFLKRNPACVECGDKATDVDHIKPRADGGTDEWTNLQALCHSCHSKKTRRGL